MPKGYCIAISLMLKDWDTRLQKRRSTKKIQCGLQIIHDWGDHWIVAANVGSDNNIVQVYNSVYTLVEEDTREVILNLFHLPDNPVIEIAKMHKQRGAKECGLFAIAVATNILSGIYKHSGVSGATDEEPPIMLSE